jgi:hypothetical protein
MFATSSATPSTSIFSGRPLARSERVIIGVTIGLGAGVAALLAFRAVPGMYTRDFTYPWRAARAILAHQDPYRVIVPSGPAPFDMPFMYPITAGIAAIPFAMLAPQIAGALFVAISVTLLAYLLMRRGLGMCWLFLSVPFALAVVLAQWSPLVTAGALALPLSWALVCKPTIGLALFAYRPSWRSAAVSAGFLALGFLIDPRWLAEWWTAARSVEGHGAPVTHAFGWIPLLALVRWRDPRARLVAVMAVVPQNMDFYDQLPLMLVAGSGSQMLGLTVLSWVAWAGTRLGCSDRYFCGTQAVPWIIWLLYVPTFAVAVWDAVAVQTVWARLRKRDGSSGAS